MGLMCAIVGLRERYNNLEEEVKEQSKTATLDWDDFLNNNSPRSFSLD